jgi:thiamine kinase-like enzyme
MIINELKGHSGCAVYLCEQNDRKFVRKVSKSRAYNTRLQRQAKKQENFNSSFLKTPEILDDGFYKGLYHFDMQYINGTQFNDFISTNVPQSINPFLDKLLTYIKSNKSENKDYTTQVQEKIKNIESISPIDIEEPIKYCLDFDWSNIPSGSCHGDLTFENMLVYKSELFLIDFLDSFIDTSYMDISKIIQDTALMWSWRNSVKSPVIKNIYIHNRIFSSFNTHEQQIVSRLLVLNLLRILPYSDKKTCIMIKNRLYYIIERLK